MEVARVRALIDSAKGKMYAARLARRTPYVDKTVYVGWNALCVSAYLEAAKVLELDDARHFALRSLDRILAEGWNAARGLLHVIAYSDPTSERREIPGLLDDYAFTAIACLDAYEATVDLSYFKFARQIVDRMVERFFDPVAGGFFDTEQSAKGSIKKLGVLHTQRKPFQDSPTPAGNSVAAIALSRMYGYTNQPSYREQAEQTLEVLAGLAGQYGLFAATYGIAAVHFSPAHLQVIILGRGPEADELKRAVGETFLLNRVLMCMERSKAVAPNLPPALAETISNLPASETPTAIVCSGFRCLPPISEAEELRKVLRQQMQR